MVVGYDIMRNTMEHLILFLIGGSVYYALEMLWRGYSHWSMFIVGGVAFILVGLINEYFTYDIPLWKQCWISMIIITILEFVSGCILNLWLGLDIWNYTVLDILGQVSLPFMAIWFGLSVVGIVLDDLLRWKLFNEEKPQYTII